MTEEKKRISRRAFMITGGIVGGGLVVGVGGISFMNKKIKEYSGEGLGDGESLNAWVNINSDNTVTIAVARAEMGQGIYTALPMLIAEELEIELSQVKVIHPQAEGPYTNTFMAGNEPRDLKDGLTMMQKVFSMVPNIITGGSTSIRDGYDHQRAVGAMARQMLITAAATKWNIKTDDCYAEKGSVINSKSKETLTFGSLAAEAAKLEQPKIADIKLKPKSEFKILGKPAKRFDVPGKVNGTAQFGLDVRIPNMKYAAMRHPSYPKGKITAINNEAEVKAMKGVSGVVMIEEGVAVVADNTWRAKNAASKLDLTEEQNEVYKDQDTFKVLKDAINGESDVVSEDIGDVENAFANATSILEAEYQVPYLAHACMEPMNCTVLIDGENAEVWVGSQAPTFVMDGVAGGAGISKSNIKINVTYLGGGFGRRAETDFITKAAKVAKAFSGTPIQLVFTREEDMQNDYYRPAVYSTIKAGLSEESIIGWKHEVAAQGAVSGLMGRNVPMMPMSDEDDPSTTEGARELPYALKNCYVGLNVADLAPGVGTWRSVGHSQNAFFTESFLDECADKLNKDPYQFRKGLIMNSPRHSAVLDKVAELSNWESPLEVGKSRGIALHKSFGSYVAQVAEISVSDNKIKVDKVYCVIDCGKIVNPDTIEAQMQSGIVYGLTAALYGEITVEKGKIKQSNFPNYKMVKMNTMPEVITHIMDSEEYPGGVGEPGTPPIAPALTNAIFSATGKRVRSLPLSNHGFKFG
jgi:isoquinoline 1-oxidoreductase beta subunit